MRTSEADRPGSKSSAVEYVGGFVEAPYGNKTDEDAVVDAWHCGGDGHVSPVVVDDGLAPAY
ncbi:hypothetical protein COV06_01170 [Candidatus Uhrbacteria bacterium CG10_big_fil_rev_8_21_14_0_10_50_16]|uniref:Uncharacterized protein n=1 Tax=Candidatus Uhrbacteria bacterium CG10_big_fil_rev_8_21_14_0_10_50_16 TaxID=1975039 RepID=A0A2H0RNB1_9BACT|nr:MAG: hypothetical protein COV06_01170 [Candidatus Uhrbacteria bacterium CG10_big_fil_rev_8_21_14_0_10_50_16]